MVNSIVEDGIRIGENSVISNCHLKVNTVNTYESSVINKLGRVSNDDGEGSDWKTSLLK